MIHRTVGESGSSWNLLRLGGEGEEGQSERCNVPPAHEIPFFSSPYRSASWGGENRARPSTSNPFHSVPCLVHRVSNPSVGHHSPGRVTVELVASNDFDEWLQRQPVDAKPDRRNVPRRETCTETEAGYDDPSGPDAGGSEAVEGAAFVFGGGRVRHLADLLSALRPC